MPTVDIELGRAELSLADLAKLSDSILLLDRNASDPVDLVVNDRTIARGELVVVGEELCVRISEVLPQEDRAS